jgi:hypothetical protein
MNRITDDDAAVPDVVLERHRLGELLPEDARRVVAALAGSETLRTRLEAIDAADVRARQEYPAAALARDVLRRSARERETSPLFHWMIPASVTLVAVLAFGYVGWRPFLASSPATMTPEAGDDRIKGPEATLMVFRDSQAGGEALRDGELARAGDVVRLGYRVADTGFGVIFSMDGRGILTQHLPDAGTAAAPLVPGSTVLLDAAYELDDAPAAERFYLVTARSPFDAGAIAAALREASLDTDAAAIRLPEQFTTTTFSLRKDRP